MTLTIIVSIIITIITIIIIIIIIIPQKWTKWMMGKMKSGHPKHDICCLIAGHVLGPATPLQGHGSASRESSTGAADFSLRSTG